MASAIAGPTKEERAIADAQVLAAAAELAVLERRLEKNTLRAPADGTVQVVVAEVGEAIHAGQPVLTIEAAANRWLSFNIREDWLLGTTVGARVDIVMAGGNGPVSATVTELLPLGQFATWQAERAVGDHDRNTLRMRVEAEGELARLELGTTVWLSRWFCVKATPNEYDAYRVRRSLDGTTLARRAGRTVVSAFQHDPSWKHNDLPSRRARHPLSS
jgi:HlyD family secretion protein